MTIKGIDCAVPLNAETARSLAAAGYRFAGRYLVPSKYAWKRLTTDEADAITAAGMNIISVFETTPYRPSGGFDNGKADGAAAYREALAVGQPTGTAIYFAVDYDAQPVDYDKIEAYVKAAAWEMPGYHGGIYGSYAIVEEMAKRNACRHFWQTFAWSRGKRSGKTNLYQYKNDVKVGELAVDLNNAYGNEGWWSTQQHELPKVEQGDARQIIGYLQAAWKAAEARTEKDEIHRLANELRKAAGLPGEPS